VDALYACLVLATLIGILYDRWAVAGACLALALLAKMQAVVILPAVATMWLLDRRAWWRLPMGMAVTTAIIVLPFLTPSGLQGMREVYLHSTGFYPVLSKNGYNAWVALFGLDQTARSDGQLLLGVISYRTSGLALFAVCACGLSVACACRFRRALRDSAHASVIFAVPALTAYAFFLANTEMHERYLFSLMPLGLPLAFMSVRGAWSYTAASALFFLNLLGVLPWTGVDRALYREFPNLPACIGVCHIFVFGHLALCLSARVMGPWAGGFNGPGWIRAA
jgi:Gpi18-like mannosyltransferase